MFITHCIFVIYLLALFTSGQNSWTHNDALLSFLSLKAWAVRRECATGVLSRVLTYRVIWRIFWDLKCTEHCAACSNQTQMARVYPNADSSLRKHEDLTQCCFNVGPAPLAVGQYWNSIGSNTRVRWAPHRCLSTPTPPLHNIFASWSGYF